MSAIINSYSSLVDSLIEVSTREWALSELSKQREQLSDLALVLWERCGIK